MYDLVCANLILDLLLAQKGRILSRLESTGIPFVRVCAVRFVSAP